jgi:putative colanic acid biosynthesis glycosyltransferase WcaI
VAAVLLRDRPIFRGALPTKMFEAMAAARPVVLSARGEAAELIERDGAGVAVPPENARALAEALTELAADPARREELGRGARRCAERHSWDLAIDAWHDLLLSVVR